MSVLGFGESRRKLYQAVGNRLVPEDHVCRHLRVLVVVILHKVLIRHAFFLFYQDRAFDHLSESRASQITGRKARIALHLLFLLQDPDR